MAGEGQADAKALLTRLAVFEVGWFATAQFRLRRGTFGIAQKYPKG